MNNISHTVITRLFYLFLFLGLLPSYIQAQQDTYRLTMSDLESQGSLIINEWIGREGDNFDWLNDSLSFEGWTIIDSRNISAEILSEWNGTGWFKTFIKVDEELINKPIPFKFDENYGALEFYLDDELIDRLGTLSSIEANTRSEIDHHAEILQFSDTLTHVFSVRYVNHNSTRFEKLDLNNGFQLQLYNFDEYIRTEEEHEKIHTHIISVIVFLVSLSIVHLLLLVFYPAGQMNFYFTFIASSVAVFTLSNNAIELFSNPDYLVIAYYVKELAWLFAYLCILKFSYSFTDKNSPKFLLVVLILALIIVTLSFFTSWSIEIFRSILSIVILLDYSRIVLIQKNKNQPVDLLLFGLGIFILMLFIQRETFINHLNGGFPFLSNMNAITVLIGSLSFYLLRDFAKAQIKLEYKYLEVQHLSERSIDQERRNKEKEFKQKLLEAENERKTAELEEARALQLSMLPTEIPSSKYWNISAKMETAYEVGGDYYDFYEASKDEFVVAVGDATGHGMKAGIIVATVKSNFLSTIGSNSLIDTLKKISAGIRNLDLRMLYMGLMLFRFKKHQFKFTSAGMPQALWYKYADRTIEEILVKAMPLGTTINFPYKELEIDAQKGDVILVVSDGLTELFNEKREQLGIDPIKDQLIKSADKSSSGILKDIFKLKENWSNGKHQEDDVTILVMKAI